MPQSEGTDREKRAELARAAVKSLRWGHKHAPETSSGHPAPYRAVALVLCGLAIGSLAATLTSNRPAETEVATITDSGLVESPAPGLEPARRTAPDAAAKPETHPRATTILGEGDGSAAGLVVYEELVDLDRLVPPRPAAEIAAAIARAEVPPVPKRRPSEFSPPAWVENAVPVRSGAGRPMIALVIDDLGLNRINANRVIELPPPLTLAFMTYAERLGRMTARARAAGHELMVHVPMEPTNPAYDTGPNALLMDNDPEELRRRLDWALGRFDGYVGINNHMGSRFTGSLLRMARVLAEVRARGLIFLDSRTTGASVGADLARRMGVPHAERDVFIDNDATDEGAIRRQLTKLETIALERGFAVGIGHPHDATIEVLGEWLREVEDRGFALVPVSAIVQHRVEIAATDLPR